MLFIIDSFNKKWLKVLKINFIVVLLTINISPLVKVGEVLPIHCRTITAYIVI